MTIKFSFNLQRVWKHYQNKNFGIISAYLGGKSKTENKQNSQKLKEDVREMGYGYKEIKGRWRAGKDNEIELEYALFIPNLTPEHAIELGKKYDQEAVLYGDKEKGVIILDFLGNGANQVFTGMDTKFEDSWIAWSEFRRHKFRFSSVEWDMPEPPEAKSYMSALSLQAYQDDKGISEYPKDVKRATLINKVIDKLKEQK